MRHTRLLKKENALLLIIDVQEKFRKHVEQFGALVRNISILAEATRLLDMPVVITEQYPQGLGSTVGEIVSYLGKYERFAKKSFSCCQVESFVKHINALGRKQIIVAGMEAQVCVNQTVHDLLVYGYEPHLIVDAIASRTIENKEIGIQKMIAAGAIVSSVETAILELLVEAGGDTFKAVQKLVK